MSRTTRKWLKGALGAVIGGAADCATVMIVAPQTFNLSDLKTLGSAALGFAIVSLALYLKQSPTPPDEPTEITPRNWEGDAQ